MPSLVAAAAALLLLAFVPGPALASAPTGIIAHVTGVQVMKTNPPMLRVEGVFKIVVDPKTYTYSKAMAGYMYFVCPSGQTSVCTMEWADLHKSIGTKSCAMFGDLNGKNGTVRAPGSTPSKPDTYPIQQGVLLSTHALGHCAGLKATSVPDAGSGAADAGTTKPDSGSTTKPDSGSTTADSGSTTKPDSGGTTTVDSGSTAKPDSGTTAADAGSTTKPKDDDGGCAVGSHHTSAGTAAALLLLLALGATLARRRRRR